MLEFASCIFSPLTSITCARPANPTLFYITETSNEAHHVHPGHEQSQMGNIKIYDCVNRRTKKTMCFYCLTNGVSWLRRDCRSPQIYGCCTHACARTRFNCFFAIVMIRIPRTLQCGSLTHTGACGHVQLFATPRDQTADPIEVNYGQMEAFEMITRRTDNKCDFSRLTDPS